jgi:hypothetical protein
MCGRPAIARGAWRRWLDDRWRPGLSSWRPRKAGPGRGSQARLGKAATIVAADDQAATGQLPAACRVPPARADQDAAPRPLDRERYAWLYDDEDIWAVVEDAAPATRGDDRGGPRA